MTKKTLFSIVLAALTLAGCAPRKEAKILEIYIPNDGNLQRYPDVESVRTVLDSVVSMGFNAIVVDIKPPVGYTYYESDIIPNIRNAKTYPDHGVSDFDMARAFIEEGHKRHLEVSLSSCTLSMGAWPLGVDGPAYTMPELEGMACVEYLPDGLHDIRDSREYGIFAFLNPALPEVRQLMVDHVREVCGRYHPDGFVLDYCRYNNYHSDFSEASHRAFEQYIGHAVEDFPYSIYTYPGDYAYEIVPGKYYRQWMEWRASVIQGLIGELAAAVREVSPRTKVGLWTASWWPWIQGNGQNWGSVTTTWIKDHEADFNFTTPGYTKTGFADLLDFYEMGAYLQRVYGPDDDESMEYAVARGKALNNGACTFLGSFAGDAENMRDAFDLMYRETDGIAFFCIDVCYHDPSKYAIIKDAIKYAKENNR